MHESPRDILRRRAPGLDLTLACLMMGLLAGCSHTPHRTSMSPSSKTTAANAAKAKGQETSSKDAERDALTEEPEETTVVMGLIGTTGSEAAIVGAFDEEGLSAAITDGADGHGGDTILGHGGDGGGGFGLGGLGSGPRGEGLGMGTRAADLPSVTLTGESITLGGPGKLEEEIILRVLRRHQSVMRYCYERALVNDPSLSGRVTLRWTIQTDGNTSTGTVTHDDMAVDQVGACIAGRLKRMRFPTPSGGEVVVERTWRFATQTAKP